MTTTPLTDQQLADRIAEAIAGHWPVTPLPNKTVLCHCGAQVKADVVRLAFREHTAEAVLAVVQPELDRLAAELGRVRAELATAQAERETARAAWRRVKAGITASADLLDEPFTNAPDQSPWKRLKPAMHALDAALKPQPPAPTTPSA